MLEYRLQFFADDDKTEEPTEKKLSDARKEGQVAKSKEIGNCLSLFALFLLLKVWVGQMGNQLLNVFRASYSRMAERLVFWQGYMPERELYAAFRDMIFYIVIILLPVLLVGFVVAFGSDVAQVKWRPTTKPLQPKLSKLNPISGFKRIFSVQSLVELVKSIAKLGLILWICYSYLKDKYTILFNLYDMPILQALHVVGDQVINLGLRISAIYAVIAFADYIYQRRKFHKDMKMTKQEVKDEYKQSEGDPQIKGKIRQKMREASMRRMMADLPKADVVITNPTHYAVAIRYDPEIAEAPMVLAKGEGYLAQRIKQIARDNGIETVENKPLARMLYHNVEIGEAVPPELYQAVAEVLAFVYHLQGKI